MKSHSLSELYRSLETCKTFPEAFQDLSRDDSDLPCVSRLVFTVSHVNVQVIKPRSLPVRRENRKLIPHTSKGNNRQLPRHTKQAAHAPQAKLEPQRSPAKGLLDIANAALKRRSAKTSQQPKTQRHEKPEKKHKAKAALVLEPEQSAGLQSKPPAFLDGDCVHANKALFLEGRVSQYRRCADLLILLE